MSSVSRPVSPNHSIIAALPIQVDVAPDAAPSSPTMPREPVRSAALPWRKRVASDAWPRQLPREEERKPGEVAWEPPLPLWNAKRPVGPTTMQPIHSAAALQRMAAAASKLSSSVPPEAQPAITDSRHAATSVMDEPSVPSLEAFAKLAADVDALRVAADASLAPSMDSLRTWREGEPRMRAELAAHFAAFKAHCESLSEHIDLASTHPAIDAALASLTGLSDLSAGFFLGTRAEEAALADAEISVREAVKADPVPEVVKLEALLQSAAVALRHSCEARRAIHTTAKTAKRAWRNYAEVEPPARAVVAAEEALERAALQERMRTEGGVALEAAMLSAQCERRRFYDDSAHEVPPHYWALIPKEQRDAMDAARRGRNELLGETRRIRSSTALEEFKDREELGRLCLWTVQHARRKALVELTLAREPQLTTSESQALYTRTFRTVEPSLRDYLVKLGAALVDKGTLRVSACANEAFIRALVTDPQFRRDLRVMMRS